jgi:hypothetical protein
MMRVSSRGSPSGSDPSPRWPCDQDDAPRAVDVGDPETRDFAGSQSSRIAAGERRSALQLDTASRNCTTSSGLRTTGSLRGSRA